MTSRMAPDVRGSDAPIAALPPEGGRVVQVRARKFANGVKQDIVLAGDSGQRGENAIEITLRTEAEGDRYENLVVLPQAADSDIQLELDAKFPGVRMSIHNYMLRNAYGPYGLASGRQAGGATCVYVWQTIDDLAPAMKLRHVTIQPTEGALRVRLCRQGMSVRQLAQIASSVVIEPSGDPLAMPLASGARAGADALAAATGEAAVAPASPTRFAGYRLPPASAETRLAAAPRGARRPVYARKASGRRIAQPHAAPPPVTQNPQLTYAPQPEFASRPVYAPAYGAGYPAGHPAAQPVAQFAAPPTAVPSVPRQQRLDLPPQAYRGPSGAAAPKPAPKP
ncbi:MAG: cellulose biosynthesis protein BcsN [Rhizobiales bacterium]|nr:cellulose biosynthesis protein BcsN [Hyphomicrobiales bacterium]